jgi:hypothetical protein
MQSSNFIPKLKIAWVICVSDYSAIRSGGDSEWHDIIFAAEDFNYTDDGKMIMRKSDLSTMTEHFQKLGFDKIFIAENPRR